MTAHPGDGDPLPTFAALFAEALDPTIVIGSQATAGEGPSILFANPAMARLAGRASASLIGRGCLSLLDPITDPVAAERLAAALDSDTPLRADVWTRRADGPPCPSRWEVLPLRAPDGAVTHRLIVLHDLTALRLAEQQRHDIAEAARRAGHDLNNMITGLVVNLSLLNGSALNDTQRQDCITDALDAARDGARTVRSLLDTLNRTTDDDAERASTGDPVPSTAGDLQASPLPPGGDGGRGTGGAARGRLLLLDDDEKLLRIMAGFLERAGFEVTATAEPSECLARFRERQAVGGDYDLVILDLTVDEGRAGTTLEMLKAIDPRVRAVAHSGHPFAEAMTTPRALGFLAAIQKPTPLSSLAATIDALLRTSV